ncbi:MAG: hypothetical protein ACREPI_00220 [Candidatus Dormibacterales bacterium]
MGDQLPDDACPFHRPFPADFDACPAYRPTQYTGLDLKYRALPPVWTCSNLEVERRPGVARGFYGRCLLGAVAQRLDWVAEVNAARLERIRALNRALAAELEKVGHAFWEAKGGQLKALRAGDDPAQSTRELEEAAARLEDAVDVYMADHARDFEALRMPLDATRDLIRAALDAMIIQDTAETRFRVSDEIVQRFPAELRNLLRPRSPA